MQQTNFYFLLIALLIMLCGIPLVDDLQVASAPLARAFIFTALLIVGVWSLKGGGRFFTAGMALVIAGVILNVLAYRSAAPILQFSSILLLIGFLIVAIVYTIRQVARDNAINASRIVGAICVYLLLGVIWALAYTLVNMTAPGSFAGFSPLQDPGWDSEWLYFSFVTMTTLGYGDILPLSAIARGLAYMQAIVGQFYIAVLVAGLVSAYVANRGQS